MKKLKLTTEAINQLFFYLNDCTPERLQVQSRIFLELLKENIAAMQKHLQLKTLELMHKGKVLISVRFNRSELLTLSYLFAAIPCNSYLKSVEYQLLRGLYV